jgi:hypothetical protein
VTNGEKLKEYQRRNRITNIVLAKRFNVSVRHVSCWRVGTYRIPHRIMKSVEGYFGLTGDELRTILIGFLELSGKNGRHDPKKVAKALNILTRKAQLIKEETP